jgi:hypothetical protein
LSLAADADAAPFRVVLGHLQNQRLNLRIETWSARTSPAAEGRPLSAHGLAMPAENRLWPDQHRDPSCPAYSVAQRGHDRPVGHVELRPLHLTANDSKLVAKKQQLRLRVTQPLAHIDEFEQ